MLVINLKRYLNIKQWYLTSEYQVSNVLRYLYTNVARYNAQLPFEN